MTPPPDDLVLELASRLQGARRILFITGAGVSAASGLPTYRGVGGLYNQTDTDEGLPIEVLLSAQIFRTQPAWTWKYIAQIEEACRGAEPNDAHVVMAALEKYTRTPTEGVSLPSLEDVWILTQNVDGLHQRAGSRQVIDIHGDVHALTCTHCAWHTEVDDYTELTDDLPPMCPSCGHVIRPKVVLFGEMLDISKLQTLDRALRRGFDLVVSVGTTSAFPYIAEPVLDAHRRNVPTVEINPSWTSVTPYVDLVIPHCAARTLSAAWEMLKTTA